MAAAALMFAGTGSDVGKSLIVAGLARAFTLRGLKVRPFKPQNMSNNAAVTADGGEIGRAQALQARAARVPPSVHMNPVLLKPQSEIGAQIVVQGRVFGSAKAAAYQHVKRDLMPFVLDSFTRMRGQADLVLVEGAGSAAEINLRDNDIANMGFARAAGVPVVLIGDIDRGGVIASLVGTKAVLAGDDAALIRGFIVNKFRGDPALFAAGMARIAALTGWQPLGLVPFFSKARMLPAEDALALETFLPRKAAKADHLAEQDGGRGAGAGENAAARAPPPPRFAIADASRRRLLDVRRPGAAYAPSPAFAGEESRRLRIAVPILPHIANFDDLDPLEAEPHVELIRVRPGRALPGDADLVVLPGSKATIAELAALRAAGCDIDIAAHRRRGRSGRHRRIARDRRGSRPARRGNDARAGQAARSGARHDVRRRAICGLRDAYRRDRGAGLRAAVRAARRRIGGRRLVGRRPGHRHLYSRAVCRRPSTRGVAEALCRRAGELRLRGLDRANARRARRAPRRAPRPRSAAQIGAMKYD